MNGHPHVWWKDENANAIEFRVSDLEIAYGIRFGRGDLIMNGLDRYSSMNQ